MSFWWRLRSSSIHPLRGSLSCLQFVVLLKSLLDRGFRRNHSPRHLLCMQEPFFLISFFLICRDRRQMFIMDSRRTNIYLSFTLKPRIHSRKFSQQFQNRGLAIQKVIAGSMNHRFGSRFFFWLSSLTNPRTKVRGLIISEVRTRGLVIWISTMLAILTGFYCGSQGAHHFGCYLDHRWIPRAHRLYQGPLHLLQSLRRVSRRSTPNAAVATVFEFCAAVLMVARCPNFSKKVMQYLDYQGNCPHLWGYLELDGKCLTACVHNWTFCRILFSQPTWPEKA